MAGGRNLSGMADGTAWQPEIEARGREIFDRMKGAKPGVFKNLPGRLMDWSMGNEALKVQLFRFVDVLPVLGSAHEIARHTREYLGDPADGLPPWARWLARNSPKFSWLTALAARQGVTRMARTFILARNGVEAVPALRKMRDEPLAFTVDILGETAVSEVEAAQYQARYLELIESLAREAATWPPVGQIDRDDRGEIPRVNVSVKISALYSHIHPADPETAIERISARLRPLLLAAKQRGVFINLDMESTALKEVTFELFERLLDEPELRDYGHAGIALQSYLRASVEDLERLMAWARARRRRVTVRLIKGAYWDYETTLARQRGWPVPVFEQKAETDANFERLARRMLENREWINCAFGTHNVRSIAACLVAAEKLGVPPDGLEFQMLHGMAEPIKAALVKSGWRVRNYCPVGEVLPGMSYFVRRLLENTSNEGFLRATFAANVSPETLLRDPATVDQQSSTASKHDTADGKANSSHNEGDIMAEPEFQNEPLMDFTIAVNRQRMREALEKTRRELGGKHPLLIGGLEVLTGQEITSINPARPAEVVGRVAKAGVKEADAAIAAARAAFASWSRTSVEERARVLERAAELLRQERFELAALEVFETGKAWVEGDADIAEAVDFCNYYAREMRRLASRRYAVPGETSLHQYIPRGIAVVIAPWNFPIAILCGMAVAALVAGNAVVMKPAEQSSVSAWRFMDILRRAGLPPGVAGFLPGAGLGGGGASGGQSRGQCHRLHRLAGGGIADLRVRGPDAAGAETSEACRLRNGRQERDDH